MQLERRLRNEGARVRSSIRVTGFVKWVGYTLFFLMLFAPTAFKPLKILLIVAVVAAITGSVLRRSGALTVHRSILAWVFFFTAVGLFYVILGLFRGNPGALPNATVFVLWPWLYVVMIAGISKEVLDGLLKTMLLATIAISVYAAQYVLHMIGVLPWFLDLGLAEEFSLHGFSLLSMSTLIFLVPYCIASLLTRERNLWLYFAVGLGLVLVLLSGRRGLILAVALSIPLSLAVRYGVSGRTVMRPALFVGGILALVFLVISPGDVAELFALALDPRLSLDASIRAEQFGDLLAEWTKRPIFGSGFGADFGAARGQAMRVEQESNTWSYELQYVTLLANTGIVGIVAYCSGIAWIYYQGVRLIKETAPILVGMTCFLVAAGTNPYLPKYDFLWVIFLPVAIINVCLIEKCKDSNRGASNDLDRGGSKEDQERQMTS